MQKIIRHVVVASLIVPLILVGSVSAIAREDGSVPEATEGEFRTLMAQSGEASVTTQDASLQTRLEQRKAEFVQRLTTTQKQRLVERCSAAQQKLGALKERVEVVRANRTGAHAKVSDKLAAAITTIQSVGVSTAALEAQQTKLTELTNSFNTELGAYEQTLADAAAMNCATDPEGFRASIAAARAARGKLAESTQAIRQHLNGVVKVALAELKASLEAPATGGAQ